MSSPKPDHLDKMVPGTDLTQGELRALLNESKDIDPKLKKLIKSRMRLGLSPLPNKMVKEWLQDPSRAAREGQKGLARVYSRDVNGRKVQVEP